MSPVVRTSMSPASFSSALRAGGSRGELGKGALAAGTATRGGTVEESVGMRARRLPVAFWGG